MSDFAQEAEKRLRDAEEKAIGNELDTQQAMAAAIVYALLDVARAIRTK